MRVKTSSRRRRIDKPARQPATSRPQLSLRKKVVFAAIVSGGFLVLLELVLGRVGVDPVLYEDDPYVGFVSSVPLFVEESGPDGKTYLATAANKLQWFNPQRFPKEKGSDTFRVFTLGGSTTYGRPYDDNASFGGWLRELLPAADSSRVWEVINAGGISGRAWQAALELAQRSAHLQLVEELRRKLTQR